MADRMAQWLQVVLTLLLGAPVLVFTWLMMSPEQQDKAIALVRSFQPTWPSGSPPRQPEIVAVPSVQPPAPALTMQPKAAQPELSSAQLANTGCADEVLAKLKEKVAALIPSGGSKFSRYQKSDTPKVLSLCIDWRSANFDTLRQQPMGIATPADQSGPVLSSKRNFARNQCEDAKMALGASIDCNCQVVEENGVISISPPPNWKPQCS